MIDRAIIPQLEEMHATLERMCDGLEEFNKTLTDDVIETQNEDEASAWLADAEESVWTAWKCIGATIAALKKED